MHLAFCFAFIFLFSIKLDEFFICDIAVNALDFTCLSFEDLLLRFVSSAFKNELLFTTYV